VIVLRDQLEDKMRMIMRMEEEKRMLNEAFINLQKSMIAREVCMCEIKKTNFLFDFFFFLNYSEYRIK
jgi:hypothetical protein